MTAFTENNQLFHQRSSANTVNDNQKFFTFFDIQISQKGIYHNSCSFISSFHFSQATAAFTMLAHTDFHFTFFDLSNDHIRSRMSSAFGCNSDRRGLVGCVPLYKIAGAAAAAGKSLEEVAAVAQKFADNMATIAVAAKGATHPATDMVIAQIEEGHLS